MTETTQPTTATTSTTPAKPARAAAKPKPRRKTAAKARTTSKRTASKPRTTAKATPQPRPAATRESAGRDALLKVLDAQQKTATVVTDYQVQAAKLSPVPGTATLVDAQVRLVRDVTDAYTGAVRELLK